MSAVTRPLIILGAGGHARVMVALARAAGYSILGVCDPAFPVNDVSSWEGIEVLGNDSSLDNFEPDRVGLVLGIGQRATGNLRESRYNALRAKGYEFPALVHPAAWVARGVALQDGVQIMAGAVVQPGCEIGENSIVNTRAGVDHGRRWRVGDRLGRHRARLDFGDGAGDPLATFARAALFGLHLLLRLQGQFGRI